MFLKIFGRHYILKYAKERSHGNKKKFHPHSENLTLPYILSYFVDFWEGKISSSPLIFNNNGGQPIIVNSTLCLDLFTLATYF